MVGKVDPETEQFWGKDIIYIYPDLKTVIIGRFDNGVMISGYMSTIEQVFVDPDTFMLHVSVCKETFGPKMKCDISTQTVISQFPLLPDLWEAQLVEVKNSTVGTDAGQGLYLKRSVSAGQIVALFNGIRCRSSRNNSNDKSPDQSYDYRIRLNGDMDIDIPPVFTQLDQYCATLGHKANHSFTPNARCQSFLIRSIEFLQANVHQYRWVRFQHPRFGLIVAIKAIKDMAEGSEVLVNYGMGMADAPIWYKMLWVKHLREDRHFSDKDIMDWCGRQYAMNGRLIDLPL